MTETTVMLIAHDGEWTRRRVDEPGGGAAVRPPAGDPDLRRALVGYPQRMRDYNERRKRADGDQLAPRADAVPRPASAWRISSQPLAAMSSIRSSRVRTGTPVPPLVQYPVGSPEW